MDDNVFFVAAFANLIVHYPIRPHENQAVVGILQLNSIITSKVVINIDNVDLDCDRNVTNFVLLAGVRDMK